MGSQGDSSREEGKRSKTALRRRPSGLGVALAVVAVVLILLLAAMYTAWVGLPDQDGPEPETIEDGVTIIRGDVVWEDLTATMERPVEVKRGGHLRIVGCELKVLIEDLALADKDWFEVRQGGTLTVEESTIEVYKDPRLDTAVCLGSKWSWAKGVGYAYLSKAIDLREVEAATLKLDVKAHGEDRGLVVAYQLTPGEDLRILDRYAFSGGTTGRWVRISQNLEGLAGNIVNLYLIPVGDLFEPFFIYDVRIDDGTDGSDQDPFNTGDPRKDRWAVVEGIDILGHLSESFWPELVRCEGSLEVISSSFVSPGDINHTGYSYRQGMIKTRTELMPWEEPEILEEVRTGGCISLINGTMMARYSHFEFITVRAENSTVEIIGSSVVGDREMVTLYQSDGRIEDTRFTMEFDEWDSWSRHYTVEYPRWWGLEVWQSGPVEVVDCTFTNTPLGIDLTHSTATVQGCAFVNCSQLGLWDHNTTGLGGWERVGGDNDFDNCEGHRYFQSHDGHTEFIHDDRPSFPLLNDTDPWGRMRGPEGDWEPAFTVFNVGYSEALMYVPTFSVDDEGNEYDIDTVILDVKTDRGREWEEVDTSESDFTLTFTGVVNMPPPVMPDELPDHLFYLDPWYEFYPNGTGMVEGWVIVYMGNLLIRDGYQLADDLEITIFLDDQVIGVEPVPFVRDNGWYKYWHYTRSNLSLAPGLNQVTYLLTGRPLGGQTVEELDRLDQTFFRFDGNTTVDQLLAAPDLEHPRILLDPGVTVDIPVDRFSSTYSNHTAKGFSVYLGTNATANVKGPITGEGPQELTIYAVGNGSLNVWNMDVENLTMFAWDCQVLMVDVDADMVANQFENAPTTVQSCNFGKDMWWYLMDTDGSFTECGFDLPGGFITPFNADLVVRDCIFTGPQGSPLSFYSNTNDTVSFIGCTFKDVPLTINVDSTTNGRAVIEGCTFSGDPSGLRVRFMSYRGEIFDTPEEYANLTVEGNTFSGSGSFLRAHRAAFDSAIGNNTFVDGAHMEVTYEKYLTLVGKDYPFSFGADLLDADGLVSWDHDWDSDLGVQILRTTLRHASWNDIDSNAVGRVVIWVGPYDNNVWFDVVDLTAEQSVISVPDWGAPHDLVTEFLERYGIYSWWSES